MKFWRLILIAGLSLLLSLGTSTLFSVKAEDSAIALLQQGKKYYDAQQFAQAAQTLQQALKISQNTKDILQQAQALTFTSLAQQKLGQWQPAQAAINQSLSLLKDLSPSPQVNQARAQAENAQAHLQLATGNGEAALAAWENAELLYSQASDRTGVMGSQMNQALAMQSLGLYRRASKILTQLEQQINQQPDSEFKVTGLLNLGNIYRQVRDLEQSHKILQTSLAIAQRVGLPQAESQVLLALGNTEVALARRAKAVQDTEIIQQYIKQALNRYQQADQVTTSQLIKAQVKLNQFAVLIESQDFSSITHLVPEITAALQQLPPSRSAIYARVNFAQNLIKFNPDYSEIQRILNTAITQSQNLADQRAESYALGIFGELYEKISAWEKAQKFTQSALIIAQASNASDIAYQWQWQMGRILQNQAEKTKNNREANPEAIKYYTQAFNTLKDLRSDLVALNPEIQFSFRETVEPVYRQLVDLFLRSSEPSREDLKQARNIMEALQLAELDNFFGDSCAKPVAVNIDNLDPNAAVVYPIILPDRLEVIIKLPGVDNLRHYANQNVSQTQVDETVNQLRQSAEKITSSLFRFKKQSQQLYNWLIKPFETELEITSNREQSQIKNLVFILDGSLRNLPMSMLYGGKKYLIERYAVSVTSGLQLLEPKPLKRENLNVLIAGATDAPSFQKAGLGTIESVALELTGIKQRVPHSQILENKKFIQENIRQEINSRPFNVVHLATHGKFSSNPEETYILDWQAQIRVKDLNELLRLDYSRMHKPIELLILSACETARGDNRAALGLAGIAISAGARSTLAAVWQVNDASTAEFMIRFYQELNKPQITKAEALRNVQLAFLHQFPNTNFHRPYHWASFILVGNWL
ncbi:MULTISPECIES: CHAT domain-containing protein [Calothrix]|uniref:CHAT domain-containing protein n=2 Tax=Calothrix TaxID=1186 RepID=A0ABR8A223_9CYAN|nr:MULTISPECIES: CHAT domain-containing protein [Calothrix]MBD2194001.1 CHAT domain-containing protein [Calothrix parietina FACHB-288]MBD2223008.1 CHAT domain-containing protein [Calothrix anomala FACHB-343]